MPERLLYAISTRGKINFINFDTAFATIYLQVLKKNPEDIDFKHLKFQTLRFLDALGHCEFDFGKRYIYACQPSLVLMPSFGLPQVLLTGARNQELVLSIKKFAARNKNAVRFYSIPQKVKHSLLPQAIYLEATDKDLLIEAATEVGVNFKIDEPCGSNIARPTT